MWQDMLTMGIPISEKVIRTVVVYGAIVVGLRLAGRRDLAQLTTFDLVVVLLLSNVVQNAIIGPDDSLTGGLIGAAVLFAANAALVRASTSSDMAEKVIEGGSVTVAEHGAYDVGALRRLAIRPHDVDTALRLQGATGVGDVRKAELRPSGTLVVELEDDAQPASRADVRRLLERLDSLETALADAIAHPAPPPDPA